ncbi:hypothetical protein BGZ49_009100 [Haplosporangium sp. Z 27]|nr:hypothetical protein BGZ49_009100 [Haplosporangium sp. Z 27]
MTSNTESNFRAAFQSFGARGGVSATDDAANSGSGSGSAFDRASSWFGGVRNQVAGYVPVSLGGGGGQPQEEDWLGLTWFQFCLIERPDGTYQGAHNQRTSTVHSSLPWINGFYPLCQSNCK